MATHWALCLKHTLLHFHDLIAAQIQNYWNFTLKKDIRYDSVDASTWFLQEGILKVYPFAYWHKSLNILSLENPI